MAGWTCPDKYWNIWKGGLEAEEFKGDGSLLTGTFDGVDVSKLSTDYQITSGALATHISTSEIHFYGSPFIGDVENQDALVRDNPLGCGVVQLSSGSYAVTTLGTIPQSVEAGTIMLCEANTSSPSGEGLSYTIDSDSQFTIYSTNGSSSIYVSYIIVGYVP